MTAAASVTVRLLRPGDVPAAMELSTGAGWNQTADDWRRMIELEPGGCFGIDSEGRLAATATLLRHGDGLAWIGMVLTRAELQRRGFARILMQHAVQLADRAGIRSLKLDATDQGEPLYRSLGFETEQGIERWRREPLGAVHSDGVPQGAIPLALDREAFGADRTRFLRALGSRVSFLPDGYALSREGSRARYLGPCVARTPDDAERLVTALLAEHPAEPWFWDHLTGNAQAGAIAEKLGFQPVRRLVRMYRGENVRGDDTLVYATAGFEAG